VYQPKIFAVRDDDVAHRFVQGNAFGALIVPRGDDTPEISHLPFLLDARAEDGRATLRVHVARANPIWKLAISASRQTVVFQGPHTYVSPTWYETPTEHVPTWNYAVVHAHCGAATILDDDAFEATLAELSARYEDADTGWRPERVDAAFRGQLMQQIVGLALPVERLEIKLKLSQNRSPEDRRRVMAQLRRRGQPDDLAMLALMGDPP
jgi:transcriptional regulator